MLFLKGRTTGQLNIVDGGYQIQWNMQVALTTMLYRINYLMDTAGFRQKANCAQPECLFDKVLLLN